MSNEPRYVKPGSIRWWVLIVAVTALASAACAERSDAEETLAIASTNPAPTATATESPVTDEVNGPLLDRFSLFTLTEPPPVVDTSVATVEIEDVVFDTFRGGFIPLSQATPQVIESLRDAIKPIYESKYEPLQSGGWLDDDELVIGYESTSGGYAYPFSMLSVYELANDVIEGVPVPISYCPLCLSAVIYDR